MLTSSPVNTGKSGALSLKITILREEEMSDTPLVDREDQDGLAILSLNGRKR